MDDQVKVTITADASGVAPGVDAAKSAVKGLQESAQSASSGMKASFASVSTSIEEMGVRIRVGATAITEFREALLGIGEALVAAFAIEQIKKFAEQLGEAAEKNKHLAETFGMTVPQVQGLKGAAEQTGMSFDTITRAMGIFDKNMIQAQSGTGTAAAAFKAMGINAKDGGDQMNLLLQVADKFKGMDDGPKKVALAMELFGRAGKDMIPFLDQGRAGIEELDNVNQKYSAGVLVATDANKQLRDWLGEVNARGDALAESMNQNKVAMDGVSNVLTDALSPMLTQAADAMNGLIENFIDSYREGGAVATVFQVISAAADVVGTALSTLGSIFKVLWTTVSETLGAIASAVREVLGTKVPADTDVAASALDSFKADMTLLKDSIIASCALIEGVIQGFVDEIVRALKVVEAAFHFDWGAIVSEWKAGTDKIASDTEQAANRIKVAMREAHLAISGNGEEDPAHGALGSIGDWFKHGSAGGGGDVDLSKPHKGKGGGGKGSDSLISDLAAKLEAQRTEYEYEQTLQSTHQEWSLQNDVDYWAQILAHANLSGEQRLAAEQKYVDAVKGANAQKLTAIQEAAKQELETAGLSHDQKIAILQKEAADVAGIYGTQSKAYQEVQDKITAEAKKASDERKAITDDNAQFAIKSAQLDLAAQESAAKFRVSMGQESQLQLLAEEKNFLAQRQAIDDQAMQAKIDAEAKDSPAYQKLLNQKLLMDKQYQNQSLTLDQQTALQKTAIERQVATEWGNSLGKMLTFQQSFTKTVQQMYMSLVNVVATAISRMVTQWIEGSVMQIAVSKTVQQQQVLMDAKKAAAGAYNALVGIPIIGPVLAPAAAAVAFTAVEAFSAEGGWGQVPYDNMPTYLHRNEMVLPASIATPIRAMAANNDNSFGGGTMGGVHNHTWNVNAMDGQSFQKMLASEEGQNGIRDAMLKASAGLKF